MKFRIVQLIHGTANLKNEDCNSTIEWIIEKKNFWGWREVFQKELYSERISHENYLDAEAYMVSNYMRGDGLLRKNGNVYTYTRYSYHFPI
jgi:hypothetical protein